ncbi:MAG: TraB/VirB10 family protein [Trichlorobacter sp.]
MHDALKQFWEQRSPKAKRWILQGLLASSVAGAVATGSLISTNTKPLSRPTAPTPIPLDPGLMARQQAADREQRLRELEAENRSLKSIPTVAPSGRIAGPERSTVLPPLPPLPPPSPRTGVPVVPGPLPALPAPPPPRQDIGEISRTRAPQIAALPPNSSPASAQPGAYLPPSFMAATLLSGLDAPTSNDARGTPVPVILRIKAPAMLPNEVKADLQGCFVIADGRGNLATERAELVLVSLSCLDTRGQAVIDQKVKGFVVDDDGKIGLRGKVVAKMGSAIARSMLAGFFGGAGDALKSAATTTSINPLGTTQTIEARDVALAGVGTGLAGGFKELQKFYLDLARQSMPVVEVGATRPVTLVISEGTTLTIRKIAKGVSR